MSCSTQIRATPENFSLAQKIIVTLSEKYEFNFDEAWSSVSSNSIQQLQKRFKKMKKDSNPLSSIKKPRSSFSLFTKENRMKIQQANPKATFGELSKLVSAAWKGLSEKQMKVYKKMEAEDKVRFEKQKAEILANLPADTTTEASTDESTSTPESSTETTSSTTAESSSKKSSKAKKTSKPTKTTKASKASGKASKVSKSTESTTTSSSSSTGSYNVFQKKNRKTLKEKHPDLGLKDINVKLGEMWRSLSVEQKAVYV